MDFIVNVIETKRYQLQAETAQEAEKIAEDKGKMVGYDRRSNVVEDRQADQRRRQEQMQAEAQARQEAAAQVPESKS